MQDRVEALERLARLRETGALTEPEYQAEKRALLAGASSGGPGNRGLSRGGLFAAVGAAALATAAGTVFVMSPSRPDDSALANKAAPIAPAALQSSIRDLPTSEQLAVAFEAAFGTRGSATRRTERATLVYRPASLEWIGDSAALISEATNSAECESCRGALGVHYLTPQGQTLRVVGSWPEQLPGANWGKPPSWSIRRNFSDYPVIYVERSATGAESVCTEASFTELRPEGPVSWGKILTDYDDTAYRTDGSGIRIKGRITNIRKNSSFQVVYSGDDSSVETYVRKGDRFVRSAQDAALPTCG